MNEMKSPVGNVIVVIGAGSIGQAIARRVSAGKHVLLADLRQENAAAAAEVRRQRLSSPSICTAPRRCWSMSDLKQPLRSTASRPCRGRTKWFQPCRQLGEMEVTTYRRGWCERPHVSSRDSGKRHQSTSEPSPPKSGGRSR